MKITLLAVGTKMPQWVNAAYEYYARRFGNDIVLDLKEIRPEKRAAGTPVSRAIMAEHARLTAAVPPHSTLIVLDETGERWSSRRLAEMLRQWIDYRMSPCFIIGGADGLSEALKERADSLLQLSAMTLPHGLVRIVLVEQLYRAFTILNNHPYHRE